METYVGKASAEIISDFRFWNRDKDQQEGESFDGFLERLRKAAQDCRFGELADRLIRSRIVIGVRDPALQRRILSESQELDLDKVIDRCRSFELGTKSADLIRSGGSGGAGSSVAAIGTSESGSRRTKMPLREPKQGCRACGLVHSGAACPAMGRRCSSCGGHNHYARMCSAPNRSRQPTSWKERTATNSRSAKDAAQQRQSQPTRKVWTLQEDDDNEESDDWEYFSVSAIKRVASIEEKHEDKWSEVVRIANRPVRCKLDTGADVSCIPMALAKQILDEDQRAKLQMVSTRLCSYFGDRYPCGSTLRLPVRYRDTRSMEEFYVLDMRVTPTLSGSAAEALGMLARVGALKQATEEMDRDATTDPRLEQYQKKYPEAFERDGLIKNYKCQIVLKQNYVPVANTCRPIPVAYQQAAKEELRRMLDRGVIAEVHEPTEFVSHIVLTKKSNGKISSRQLCLDPTHLNRAIERGHHPMKRFEQISTQMSGARYFSTLDAREGFWQVELDERSSKLCTFITQWGRFRFLRMPYGISCASDEFQRITDELFRDMPGVATVVDDIIVWADNEKEHERRLDAVIRQCAKAGLALNKTKCKLVRTSVSYLGHMISSEGVSMDATRAEDIRKIPAPRTLKELQAFLGMTNFVANFIPQYADLTLPLRELLKKDTHYIWEDRHQKAFERLKRFQC